MYVNVCRCNIIYLYTVFIIYGVITFMMRSCQHAIFVTHALLHRKTKDNKYFKVFEMAS